MAFRYLGIMHPHPVFILVADVLPVLEISRLHAAGAKTTVKASVGQLVHVYRFDLAT